MAKSHPAPGAPRAPRRRFNDAPFDERCCASIQFRDGSRAQCGRRRTQGRYHCWQHDAGAPPGPEETTSFRLGYMQGRGAA